MNIENIAINAKLVIESLIEVLGCEGIDAHSIKFEIGNQEDSHKIKDMDFGKLIDVTLKQLNEIKSTPRSFVLPAKPKSMLPEKSPEDDVWIKNRTNKLQSSGLSFPMALLQAHQEFMDKGFVLVPRVPTEEMIQRGTKANSECLNENAPLGERLYRHPAIQVYTAMVAELEKSHD